MGEKDDALFDKKVRGVIRKCILVASPVWGIVIMAIGWWCNGIDTGLKNNTSSLARTEITLDYIAQQLKDK